MFLAIGSLFVVEQWGQIFFCGSEVFQCGLVSTVVVHYLTLLYLKRSFVGASV